MANILDYEHLMSSDTNPDLFYPFGRCVQEIKVNQDVDHGFSRNGSAYLDGLWRFTLEESETANVSYNRALDLEQCLVDAAFALGVV